MQIQQNKLGDDGAQLIAEGIKWTKSIIKLNISANEIYERGAVHLFEALESNESIVDFTIGSTNWMFKNKIGPNGVFPLWSLLMNNQVLTFLNISGCSIADEGLDHVIQGLIYN